jgi:hypothetical protein
VRTKTALVELPKDRRDLRVFFKGCCEASAARLRVQSWQFREELADRGYVVNVREVQDSVFELTRDLFSESPGADFVTWAGLLVRGRSRSPPRALREPLPGGEGHYGPLRCVVPKRRS